MLEINHSQSSGQMREARQCWTLSQNKVAAKLGGSFQSIDRWQHGRTKPIPVAVKQIEVLWHQMSDVGADLFLNSFLE